MKYFIANWKANKNLDEALDWLDRLLKLPFRNDRAKMVVCPPFHLIYPLKLKLKSNPLISLGAQNISAFESGSYTGEVTAKSLQGLVEYTIIGHSERREYFNEKYDILLKKTRLAKKYQIEPIFCVRGENDAIPAGVRIVAYEPTYTIGSGNNELIEKVLEAKQKLKLPKNVIFIYGGSVNKNNVPSYLRSQEIDGLLVGGASLDPKEFHDIVNPA